MAEIALSSQKSQAQLSVHILLPEAVDRRLDRWTKRMPGTSWPSWGGHITLVPNFVPRGSAEEVRAIVQRVCATATPFTVRFAAPIAIQDMTRPDYFAVFMTVEESQTNEDPYQLQELRAKLLAALEPMREDTRPRLVEQPFLPHVTLALGLGESEARKLVQQMRADPLVAEFRVETIWLVTRTVGEGTRFDRKPIAFGRGASVGMLRD